MIPISLDTEITLGIEVNSAEQNTKDEFDLDALLKSSMALADAKRCKKAGRKLTLEAQELLDANALASNMIVWKDIAALAHFVTNVCSCGKSTTYFNSWYIVSNKKGSTAKKLTRSDSSNNLEQQAYHSFELKPNCKHCIEIAPDAGHNTDEYEALFKALGEEGCEQN